MSSVVHLVGGGRDPLMPVGSLKPATRPTTVEGSLVKCKIAHADIRAPRMVQSVLASPELNEECLALMNSSPATYRVAHRAISWLTDRFPAISSDYSCAAVEVLDMASVTYQTGSRSNADRTASFLDAVVRGCTQAIAHRVVSVSAPGTDSDVTWSPWEHGELCEWLLLQNGDELKFQLRHVLEREEVHALRSMLYLRMLTWTDMMAITRAGIDATSVDLF